MTDQELFDKVAAHLRAQNAKALNQDGTCMYRAPDGKKCAAGCLILDEYYAPAKEGKSVRDPSVRWILLTSGVAESQFELVRALQYVHDNMRVDQWEFELTRVAEQHNLTPLFGGHPRNHLFGCAYKNKPALGVAACDCGAYSPPAAP